MLAVTWRTNHNRERRMSCTERLRSHFRIPTRTRCAACRTEQRTAAVPRIGQTWRTNHNRERRMSCTERLRSHFRIPTRTRCAACRTEQRTAAVPRIGHEVAAETAERTSTGSMRPAAQSLAVSALSR